MSAGRPPNRLNSIVASDFGLMFSILSTATPASRTAATLASFGMITMVLFGF